MLSKSGSTLELKMLAERLAEVEKRLERLDAFLRLDVWIEKKGLSTIETKLLTLIAQGYETRDLMKKLGLTERYILSARARLHRKLGTEGNKSKLILIAYQLGLVVAGEQ